MKVVLRRIAAFFLLSCALMWGLLADRPAIAPQLAAMLPEGALLYLEAGDFHSLLADWNASQEKRAWLTSDSHAAFSRSRLYSRLGQAQEEFAAAAGIPADAGLLEKVAGKESCLGLYDIGRLEFVYVTRLQQQDIENTPLWQTRGKFEQRSEAGTPFYVRQDLASHREAAFAVRDGWLILGTRQNLVAEVIDHMGQPASHSLAAEAWFAGTVRAASGPAGDLRMVLDLDRIVPSPYFRSYWVQRNVTEMKQYAAAVSDLYRTPDSYREERVLLRRPAIAIAPAVTVSDVTGMAGMAPADAGFWSAQASPKTDDVLQILRSNFLEIKPQLQANDSYAPSAAVVSDFGSASDLEVRIDEAPRVERQADAYAALRSLLETTQPDAVLQVYSTGKPHNGIFIPMRSGIVLSSAHSWNEAKVKEALTAAILPGLTASHLGADWRPIQGEGGTYFALRGQLPLYAAARGEKLFLCNDAQMLEDLLRRPQVSAPPSRTPVTYIADLRHGLEQENFRALTLSLDRAGHRAASGGDAAGQRPAFFSGNIAGLSRAFSRMTEERVEERDLGGNVTQTVTYKWKQ